MQSLQKTFLLRECTRFDSVIRDLGRGVDSA